MKQRGTGGRKPGRAGDFKSRAGERASRRAAAPPSPLSGPAPAERPWSVPFEVRDIPPTGRRIELTADAATRQAVAKATGLLALPRLEAVFDVMPIAGGSVHVSGQVSATVEQQCVVTLEPMQGQVEEPLDLVFRTPDHREPGATEVVATVDAVDPPEDLIGGSIDLGAVALEFLLLGIDPYPRTPDAAFERPAEAADPAAHPFAALAVLKKDSGGQTR